MMASSAFQLTGNYTGFDNGYKKQQPMLTGQHMLVYGFNGNLFQK